MYGEGDDSGGGTMIYIDQWWWGDSGRSGGGEGGESGCAIVSVRRDPLNVRDCSFLRSTSASGTRN